MKFFLVILLVFLSFYSCKNESLHKIDVSGIDVNFSIHRFDIDFYAAKANNLSHVKSKYPYLFPKEITDSISLAKISSKDEQELFAETQEIYKDFTLQKKQLTSLFKYIKYYNPKFKAPNVVTMLTNIDYESRVVNADSLLIISLDVYLGENHQFYNDFPKYIKQNNTKKHLIVDVASSFISKQIPKNISRSFLEKMIYEGKKMYLLDLYLPMLSDENKIGYNPVKMEWVNVNEETIWSYFIEKKLLFSTDKKLNQRFLEVAPFSKFYSEQDHLSPGKIGVWVGWQIVRSYMKHNNVSLQELLKINALELFKSSQYKPKK